MVTGDGKRTLDRFCEWANRYKNEDPYYIKSFDVALYITRKDIGPAGKYLVMPRGGAGRGDSGLLLFNMLCVIQFVKNIQ